MSTITINPERKTWLEARRKGIGASDAASIMGCGYGSPLKVWLSKVHPEMLEEEDNRELLEFGLDVEPAIARAYERTTGRKIRPYMSGENGIAVHPQYPEIICTPDRIEADGTRLVQLKWESRFAEKFGDPGTDQVPDAYLIQCAHEMAVVGCEFEDIATMHAGPPVLIYPLRRDPELEKIVIDACRAFWADYVITKREPPIDASRDWAAYIEKKFPENRGEIIKTTPESNKTCAMLGPVLDALKESESAVEEVKNTIKYLIGDADGIEGEFGRITWRKSKDTIEDVVDWQDVAEQMAIERFTPDRFKEIIEDHTLKDVVLRKGSRRFVTKFK